MSPRYEGKPTAITSAWRLTTGAGGDVWLQPVDIVATKATAIVAMAGEDWNRWPILMVIAATGGDEVRVAPDVVTPDR